MSFAFFSCGDHDDDDSSKSPDDDDNDDNDDDDDTPWTPPTEVKIEKFFSPDQYSFKVVFTQDIGVEIALDEDTYFLDYINKDGYKTNVFIDGLEYDSEEKTVTINIFGKGRLGLTYMVLIRPKDFNRVDSSCICADTAKFWVINFAGGSEDQMQITANRIGVDENIVAYVEEGQSITNTEKTLDEWENKIYPTMVNVFREPSDIDNNGKVTVLAYYTGGSIGGYYDPMNLYSDSSLYEHYGIHSNEMELLHINSQDHSLAWDHTLPHEFQHLLYHVEHEESMMSGENWTYHNEGLSENAVILLYGENQRSIDYYLHDYSGYIAKGDPLVKWGSNYSDYALAYLFVGYLAGMGGGTAFLTDIFNIESGNPDAVTGLIQFLLGAGHDFDSVQLDWMIANWLQEPSGKYGYNGYLSFAEKSSPTVSTGTESLDLSPTGGGYFVLTQSSVSYPGTQGANIVYAGIDSNGNVDYDEPFDVDAGVLVTLNTGDDYSGWTKEHSGPDIAAVDKAMSVVPDDWVDVPRCWNDPPPVLPWERHKLKSWYEKFLVREAEYLLRQ